jgi:hypothetical protein
MFERMIQQTADLHRRLKINGVPQGDFLPYKYYPSTYKQGKKTI